MSANRRDIYDLLGALDAARAVADCIKDSLSAPPDVEHLTRLIYGVGLLLERAQETAHRIEQPLC